MKLLEYPATIVRDEHSAEDVYQQVAMLTVENRQEFESIDHLESWLFCTAKHRGIDQLFIIHKKEVQSMAAIFSLGSVTRVWVI